MTPNDKWTQAVIVKSATNGIMGMYGEDVSTTSRYFFYTKFQLTVDICPSGDQKMRFWCQIGDSTSDWHGVEYEVDLSHGVTTTNEALNSLRATNNIFIAKNENSYNYAYNGDLDCTFKGTALCS